MTIVLRTTKGSALTHEELDGNFNDLNSKISALKSTQYETPLTSDEIVVADGVKNLIIEPAGTLAALTVDFPANPVDHDKFTMTSTEIVTTLTLDGGTNTINGGITAFAANGFASYIYHDDTTSWYRVG